jgi:putative endonuclease
VECADGTLYCGVAKDAAKRMAEHNGILPGGARYTRGRRPVVLLASRMCPSKGEALKLERTIKARPREEKLPFLQTMGGMRQVPGEEAVRERRIR